MRAALVCEFRKFTSTRLWWLLLIIMGAYMAFLGVVMAFSLTVDSADSGAATGPRETVESVYTLGTTLGYVFPLIIGALAMTGEFRHQTLTPTFLFEPSRGRVLMAKLLVTGAIGVAFGAIGTAAAVAGGIPVFVWQDVPLLLGDGGIWTSMALSVVALALWSLIGVGLGTVLPNQVASIIVILAFTQFVEPLLRLGLSAVDALADVAMFLPGAAAEAVVGSSLYSAGGMLDLLPRWAGAAVMLAYIVLIAVVGRFTTLRRDIT